MFVNRYTLVERHQHLQSDLVEAEAVGAIYMEIKGVLHHLEEIVLIKILSKT